MTIVPDTKDWTWVLERPCPECGFDAAAVVPQDVPRAVLANAATWAAVLEREDVRTRPDPGTWSPLEYACHVRDVLRLFDRRLARMLAEDDPLLANWDQDATAVAERYGEQDPARVRSALQEAAEAIAARFTSVHGPAWSRPARRSDGAAFTVDTFARYFLHDLVHHVRDVSR